MPRKILITGATSEIGRSIFKALWSEEDYFILQGLRNMETLESASSQFGKNFELLCVDLTDDNQKRQLEDIARDADVFVHAAAVTKTDLLPLLKPDDIKAMLAVNVGAFISLSRAVVPSMCSKRRGCIVAISSVSARRGNRGQTVYAGTKGFIDAFVRALAAEYGSKGIRANSVAPGPVMAGSLKELMNYGEEEVRQSIVSRRLGNPEDVAGVVKFLCGKDASYINGTCISVDGGFLRGVG